MGSTKGVCDHVAIVDVSRLGASVIIREGDELRTTIVITGPFLQRRKVKYRSGAMGHTNGSIKLTLFSTDYAPTGDPRRLPREFAPDRYHKFEKMNSQSRVTVEVVVPRGTRVLY